MLLSVLHHNMAVEEPVALGDCTHSKPSLNRRVTTILLFL